MSQYNNQFDGDFNAPTDLFAAAASADARAAFIGKTYAYLVAGVLAIVAIEFILFSALGGRAVGIANAMSGGAWIAVVLLFMGAHWVANSMALNSTSRGIQIAGLALYTVVSAAVLFPLLTMALLIDETGRLIASAGLATGGLFTLMSLAVFITRKDFSFLGSLLWFGGMAAFGFVLFSVITGFSGGAIFIYLMIALACGYILYDTSNVLHHYRVDQHVAASLALLSSLFILFWYVLQLFMRRD
jgi:FtsH-binding integral membrane protein